MASTLLLMLSAFALSFFVVYPIIQSKTRKGLWNRHSSNHHANDLLERKQTIYTAIKDIEFDYQMGKLSEADFKELRQQYKDEAVGLLRRIDHMQGRKAKAKRRHVQGKGQRKGANKQANFCWICGTAATKEDTFCANCGNKIR